MREVCGWLEGRRWGLSFAMATLPETNMATQKGPYKDYSPFKKGLIWVSMLVWGSVWGFGAVGRGCRGFEGLGGSGFTRFRGFMKDLGVEGTCDSVHRSARASSQWDSEASKRAVWPRPTSWHDVGCSLNSVIIGNYYRGY